MSSFCIHCESQLCLFCQYEVEMVPGFEKWLSAIQEKHGLVVHCDNSKKMKYCYRQFTLFINEGPLEAGIRYELPICIVKKVCAISPNEDGNPWMGLHHT